MNSNMRWSMSLPGEGDPGGLEDVFPALAGDGAEPPVLEVKEAVEGTGGDEVRHLELPPKPFPRRFLLALRDARDVGRVADEVQDAHRPLRAAEPQHDLVGRILAGGLHGHLAGLQQVRHGLGHGGAIELARGRVRVVEVPAPGRVDPELDVLPERGRDAAPALDDYGPARPELRQPDARARKRS